jgi:hypothetical protein
MQEEVDRISDEWFKPDMNIPFNDFDQNGDRQRIGNILNWKKKDQIDFNSC